MNRDIEIYCDEKVISIFGEKSKKEYALSLINMAENERKFSRLYSFFGKNAIEERIIMIMKFKKISKLCVASAIIIIFGVTSIFAMTTAIQKPDGTVEYSTDNKRLTVVKYESPSISISTDDGKSYTYNESGEIVEDESEDYYSNIQLEKYTAEEYEQRIKEYITNYKKYISYIRKSKSYSKSKEQREQKIYEETLKHMQEELEAIKSGKGTVYKPIDIDNPEYEDESDNGIICSSISLATHHTDTKICIVGSVGDKELGPFETIEEYEKAKEEYLQEEVKAGRMTQKEADKLREINPPKSKNE